MDSTARLRTVICGGVFTGIVIGYLRDGEAVVARGEAGPHRVLLPMRLFSERPTVGSRLAYQVAIGKDRASIGVRLVKTRSMQ